MIYKETYWMNLVLFCTFILGFIVTNSSLSHYGITTRYADFMLWNCLTFFSALALYYDDKDLLWRLALTANLTMLLIGFLTISLIAHKDPSNHFLISEKRIRYIYLTIYLFLVSGINLRALFKLKNTNEYLKNTPYKALFIVLIFAFIAYSQPYLPTITSNIRMFYVLVIPLFILRKYLTRFR